MQCLFLYLLNDDLCITNPIELKALCRRFCDGSLFGMIFDVILPMLRIRFLRLFVLILIFSIMTSTYEALAMLR